ncbi:MAG TPA: hypothetical protein ENN80_05095 [Candidatus Hydrogenedentes bacterium]|nr:hypothetical protein [Candidatus Hydrogenedentota bacterium]
MATKYIRKGYRHKALGSGTEYDASPPRLRLGLRQRLMLDYVGIAAFAIVLGLSQVVVPRLQFEGQPLFDGEGVVLEKRMLSVSSDNPQYAIHIEVTPAEGAPWQGLVAVQPAEWEAMSEGAAVMVSYQVSRWGDKARVLEVHRVAPAEPIH